MTFLMHTVSVFGAMLVLFPLELLFSSNIILAVFGPALVIFLIALQTLIVYNRRRRENGSVEGGGRIALVKAAWKWFIHLRWLGPWVKFWLALLLGVGLQVVLVYGYIQLNPFVSATLPLAVRSALTWIPDYLFPTLCRLRFQSRTRLPLLSVCPPNPYPLASSPTTRAAETLGPVANVHFYMGAPYPFDHRGGHIRCGQLLLGDRMERSCIYCHCPRMSGGHVWREGHGRRGTEMGSPWGEVR
jgi:hypothetical protein